MNWMGRDQYYEDGWDYGEKYWPRYWTQPKENSQERRMESIWPLGSVLSVKYREPPGSRLARRIKYLAAVVTTGVQAVYISGIFVILTS